MTLTASNLFAHPGTPHTRRHAPAGYTDYGSYKPWLRDEFGFRCVYCLVRESWHPLRDAAFSVDHLAPVSAAPGRVCDYTNLVYACVGCNSARRAEKVPDPCAVAYGTLLRAGDDGLVEGVTAEGKEVIKALALNSTAQVRIRVTMVRQLERLLRARKDREADLSAWFGYPDDLPDLAALRPPGGNALPAGLHTSHHARRSRGELPAVY